VSLWAQRFATCFGVGWSPIAPGTVASLVALPFGWVLVLLGWQSILVGALLATGLGIWACGVYARKNRIHDPAECVLDEVAGQWFGLIPVAVEMRGGDWRPFVMGFIFFRLFDILKPWPISAVEKLPGGLGIMMDDVLAGFIAAALLLGTLAIRLV
jgi:phosphatidylglycerophosphatase A